MQQKSYLHCFSHNGLHGTLDGHSAVVNLQILKAAYGIEYFEGWSLSQFP